MEQHDRFAGTVVLEGQIHRHGSALRRHGGRRRRRRPSGRRTHWCPPSRPARPGRRQRGPTGCEPGHHLVEHALGVAHPQVLGTLDRDDLRLGHPRKRSRLEWTNVVVELRDQRDEGTAVGGPCVEIVVGARPQWRGEQDRPTTTGSRPYRSAKSEPNDQARSHTCGRSWYSAYSRAAARSYRSPSPASNSPSLVPCRLLVPRLLKRSTARSASAGSRQAALRNRWLSIMPPCVGSGWRQTRVAIGLCSGGNATSPTSARPSEVCRVSASRRAGRTVLPRMRDCEVMMPSSLSTPSGRPGPSHRGARRSRLCQQDVCQCRRSCEPPPVSVPPSTGQVTTCGVAGGISWSQPGHR